MKSALLSFMLLAGLPALAQTSSTNSTGEASPYNFGGVQFPRIEADNRVTFHFRAPDAQKVQVSINSHNFDMTKGDGGVWAYTSDPQAPGYHNYWLVQDGNIVLDPNVQTFIGYSHLCNGFEIPDPDSGFYQLKDVPHGRVELRDYYAKSASAWHRIFIYTPPGYEANADTRYPVLYLQHGGGEDRRVWIEMGRANTILDNLLSEGKVKPMIVVMETSVTPTPGTGGGGGRGPGAGGPPGARGTNTPAGGRGPGRGGRGGGFNFSAFEHVLVDDLIPFVDSNYRTLSDQPHRAMAGLSMGGMQTHNITLAHLDKFSHIGIFSGGSIGTNEITDLDAFKKEVKVVFCSFGSLEPGAPGAKTNVELLKQEGINAHYFESPGTAHEWQTWRRSFHEFAPMLFQD